MAISVLFSKRSNERSIVNSKDEYSDKKNVFHRRFQQLNATSFSILGFH